MSGRSVRLLLARHGRTVWHGDNRYAGRTDVALDETGRLQAVGLAHRAREERIDLAVCSPLSRAVETARPAAEASGTELLREERLREVDFGDWEGRTLEEVRAEDPLAVERFEMDPLTYPFPNGEPLPEAMQRALDALHELRRSYAGHTALIVSHNTLLRLALCSLLGIPLGDYRRRLPRLANAAVSELHLAPDGAALYTLNDPGHLRGVELP